MRARVAMMAFALAIAGDARGQTTSATGTTGATGASVQGVLARVAQRYNGASDVEIEFEQLSRNRLSGNEHGSVVFTPPAGTQVVGGPC